MAFCEKPPKRVDLAKTSNFFVQTTMSQGFDQILGKKLQKVWHFVKNHQNVSISPKLATFLCKLQCFEQKVAKTMAFCKKPPKRVDLAKTSNFFVQTTMSQGFNQILSKKLQKLWHFVKNYQNVSISPKLATFLCKLQCLRVLTKF